MLYQTLFFTGAIGFFAMVLLGTFHGSRGIGKHGRHGHHARHSGNLGKMGKLRFFLAISPIDIFAICLGVGASGLLLPNSLSATIILIVALLIGIAFDIAFLKPIFNFALRFVSTPSDGLEGMVAKFATSVSNFDSSGRGLVLMVIDAEEKQLLATLEENERGKSVKKGEQLIVTGVDPRRNTCSVSRM